jgi:DNA polymerase-4
MARWPRQILFGDIDAMYASAAVVADPSLAEKIVAVGGPAPRGIITSASYAARRHGVRSAMPTGQALRLCPALTVVPPDFTLYRRLHDRMREAVDRVLPLVEWSSIDEFYADTTDLQTRHPDPYALAAMVKDAIRDETGLTCTVAVAASKVTAKIAADAHKPNGLMVVPPGGQAAFLAPRPVSALPGIGPKTTPQLHAHGVRTIGDLLDPRHEAALRRLWGNGLAALQALARGEDADPVVADRGAKSIGHETTFDQDTEDPATLATTLRGFLSGLAHELRRDGLAASGFTIKLKDSRFRIATRQRRFPAPLNYDADMWRHIEPALHELAAPGVRYRLAGVSLSGLVPASGGLFDAQRPKALAALDALIDRYGPGAIRLGGLPERD